MAPNKKVASIEKMTRPHAQTLAQVMFSTQNQCALQKESWQTDNVEFETIYQQPAGKPGGGTC